MHATATLLAAVNDIRVHKAVDEMRNGAYQITLTVRSDMEVRGRVQHIDGKEYDCTITAAGTLCSCPDALYRRRICKHAILLALYELSTPPALAHAGPDLSSSETTRPPDLRLGKVRQNFGFPP
jgi:hypothetical protein